MLITKGWMTKRTNNKKGRITERANNKSMNDKKGEWQKGEWQNGLMTKRSNDKKVETKNANNNSKWQKGWIKKENKMEPDAKCTVGTWIEMAESPNTYNFFLKKIFWLEYIHNAITNSQILLLFHTNVNSVHVQIFTQQTKIKKKTLENFSNTRHVPHSYPVKRQKHSINLYQNKISCSSCSITIQCKHKNAKKVSIAQQHITNQKKLRHEKSNK